MVLLSLPRFAKSLQLLKARTLLFEQDHFKDLPVAFQKFYQEWKWQEPSPVYTFPEKGKYKLNPESGMPVPIVNIPIPTLWAPELDNMLLGGEAIVKGFLQRKERVRRVPHWWVPTLTRTVIYSEILNKYMPVIATKRLIELVHEHKGFDNYILQSPACDLRSLLGIKIKRKILMALATGNLYPDDEEKRASILEKYKEYIKPMEEVEWYGLTMKEAMIKNHLSKQVESKPLKHLYRQELLQYLRESKDTEIEDSSDKSWLKKIGSKLSMSK